MTLLELQDVLAERIRLVSSPEAKGDKEMNAQTSLVIGLAKQFVNVTDCIIRAEKMNNEMTGFKNSISYKLINGKEKSQV